jgi:copper resistance protein B
MTRILTPLVSAIALLSAAPAFAQDHSMHDMPGMAPPGGRGRRRRKEGQGRRAAPQARYQAARSETSRRRPPCPAMDHSQHGHDRHAPEPPPCPACK